MKKFLSVIFAVIMTFSALSVSAATGSYAITWDDFNGNPYTEAVINGNYELDYSGDAYVPVYIIEVGTTVRVELPTSLMFITDNDVETYADGGKAEGGLLYSSPDTYSDACTVTNVNAASYNDGYSDYTYYKPGITVCFNKPGSYTIETFGANIPGENLPYSTSFYASFTVLGKGGIAESHTARYTNSTVLVNGVATSFEAYNIGGNNYFKLRDLAMALNGTDKQFEVTWNAEAGSIGLIPGQAYTPVGGELVAGNGANKECNPSTSRLYRYTQTGLGLMPFEMEIKAYNINGNNYFKLRDICQRLDVGVTWDGATSTIGIDTSIPYTE